MPGPIALCLVRRAARRSRAAALALAVSLGLAASAAPAVLRVGAASSLREAAEASARAFEATHQEATVEISYGASSVLASQLRAGAPLDVLLSADAEIVRHLERDGVVRSPRPFARNRLVVLVRQGLPAFSRAGDLAGPAVRRVAVAHAAVPAGRYARAWLQARGLLDALRPRLVSTEHARATLLAVDQGHVDAAIVYATDAAIARRAQLAWTIAPEEQPEILYVAAVRSEARDAASADAFVELLVSGAGRAHLARAGFAAAPAP